MENDVGTHLLTQRTAGQVEAHLIRAGPHLSALLSKMSGRDVYQRSQFVRNKFLEGFLLIFSKTLQPAGMTINHEAEVKLRPTCFTGLWVTR